MPVKLRVANDYAAVIEGQRAGNIQIAYYGPASYSKAYLTGVKTEPFVTTRNNDGAIGYYSVIYVKADSPYKDIHDLKGKTIGFVDPNSTSGYNTPRFYLHKIGIDVDSFFGKSIITGSHENAHYRARARDGRLRRELVERGQRLEPDPHGQQGHGEKGGLPDYLQVRPAARLALRLSLRSAGRLKKAIGTRSPRRRPRTRPRSTACPTARTRSSSRSRTRTMPTPSR